MRKIIPLNDNWLFVDRDAIRLAHHQHAQDFYDACDELGFVVWAEIPFITIMNEEPAIYELPAVRLRKEMRQEMLQDVPADVLAQPVSAPEGRWSARDPVSELAQREETRPLLEKAVFLAFKLGEYAKVDITGMLNRFPDGPLESLRPLQGDPQLLRAISWRLNQISK